MNKEQEVKTEEDQQKTIIKEIVKIDKLPSNPILPEEFWVDFKSKYPLTEEFWEELLAYRNLKND